MKKSGLCLVVAGIMVVGGLVGAGMLQDPTELPAAPTPEFQQSWPWPPYSCQCFSCCINWTCWDGPVIALCDNGFQREPAAAERLFAESDQVCTAAAPSIGG